MYYILMLFSFIQNNIVLTSILIFLSIFLFIYYIKPIYLFNNDGSLKEFGIGYKNKTVFPLWVFSIVIGIFSYLFVLFYVRETKKLSI